MKKVEEKLDQLKRECLEKEKRLKQALKEKEDASQQESEMKEQKAQYLLQAQHKEKLKKEKSELLLQLQQKNQLLSKKIDAARSQRQSRLIHLRQEYETEQKKCALPISQDNLSQQIEKNKMLSEQQKRAEIQLAEEALLLESENKAVAAESASEEELKQEIASLKENLYREKQQNEQILIEYQAYLASADKQRLDFLNNALEPGRVAQINADRASIQKAHKTLSIFSKNAAADVQPPEGYTPEQVVFQ